MASPTHHPQTPAERLVAFSIEWTWPLWLVGGLYIAGPVLGWTLTGMVALALYLGGLPGAGGKPVPTPFAIKVWMVGMAAMLVILWIGHANFELGMGKTIKSSIGWAKGWA